MKLYKSLFIASAIIGGVLTSCSDDGYWDKASRGDLGLGAEGTTYTFNNSSSSYVYGPDDLTKGNKLEIQVTRGTDQGTVTLPISAVFDPDTIMSGPESVTFQDGSTTAIYVIDVLDNLEIGQSATATLTIDPSDLGLTPVEAPADSLIESEKATHEDSLEYDKQKAAYDTYVKQLKEYNLSTEIAIAKDYSWNTIGKVTYRDDCVTGYYDAAEPQTYQLEIRECGQIPGFYRIVNPYGEAYPYNESGDYDPDTEHYLEIHAEDPNRVWFGEMDSSMDWGDGPFCMISFAGYYLARGNSMDDVAEAGLFGTLKDGIITFPTKGILIGCGDDGWYYGNLSGMFAIAMPGYTLADYSCSIEYQGLFTDSEENQFVMTNLDVSDDVEQAWIVVVPGKDNIKGAYSGLLDGSITPYATESEAEEGAEREAAAEEEGELKYMVWNKGDDTELKIPMIKDAPTGQYTVAVFAFGADAESIEDFKEYDYATFKYTGAGEPETPEEWTPLSFGDFTYNLFFCNEDGSPYLVNDLVFSQSNKGRYKISHWGYNVDFFFTMDEEGTLSVEEQETGYEMGDYGPVYVATFDQAFSEYDPESDRSYYDNETQTFHFMLAYYVSAGLLRGGYGEETYVITRDYEEGDDSGEQTKSRLTAPWSKSNVKISKARTLKRQAKKSNVRIQRRNVRVKADLRML